MKIAGTTLTEAVENFTQLRRWKPFQYSGKWVVAIFGGEAFAFRSKTPILAKLQKAGLESVETAEVG